MSCSFYGCKRTYNSPEALSNHLQDHNKNTAQSLPGISILNHLIKLFCTDVFVTPGTFLIKLSSHKLCQADSLVSNASSLFSRKSFPVLSNRM